MNGALKKKLVSRIGSSPLALCAGRFLGLRGRYIYRRNGGLRLRYMAAVSVSAFVLAANGIVFAVENAGGLFPSHLASFDVARSSYDDPDRRLAAGRERMGRYMRRNDSPEIDPAIGAAITDLPEQVSGPREKIVEIEKGDTLAGVLQKAGVSSGDSSQIVDALKGHYDPRTIRPGQEIHLRFDPVPDDDGRTAYDLTKLQMSIDPLKKVSLEKEGDGVFSTDVEEKETKTRVYVREADIETSLYGSALKAGIPASAVSETIRIYSWDVDFQRDIRHGDRLEIMYEQSETEDGIPLGAPEVIFARLNVGGTEMPVYRFETKDGIVDYYNGKGVSVRKALLTTPVDGARISSGYGMRRHPILGYTKMHKGVDFAGSAGTPIYAAGDGVIEHIGRNGAYGNYIRIRHSSGTKTAYAHMQKFAKGLTTGNRVKQGQAIGYIGSTGRSTGPHLHYEVLVNNVQVNPRNVKMQQGENLRGSRLAAFRAEVRDIGQRYQMLAGQARFAEASGRPDKNYRN